MTRRGEEREIRLIDLLVYILLHWRRIIVWMLIGAVLFGGYSYYNSAQSAKQQEAMVENQKDRETALAELQSMLTTEQLSNVNRAIQYEAFDDYYNRSILMKINPAEVCNAKLLYMVKSDSVEESTNIRQAYEELITGGFLQWLKENTSEDVSSEISELVIVNDGDEEILGQKAVVSKEECILIEISVVHSSAEECKKLASYLKEYVEEQAATQKSKLGNHELVYISESFEVIVDNELMKRQMNTLSNMETARKALKTVKDGFSSLESRYYELCTTEETESVDRTEIKIQSPAVSTKYVVLGIVVFAFLYVFLLFMVYIMNTKIRITDDISSMCPIAQLGTITKPLEKKRLFGKIDLWVYKLQNRNKRIFSKEEEIGLAISAIKIAAKKSELTDILCLGTAWTEAAYDIAETMKTSLAQEGINVQIVKNVLYDQESLGLLDGASGAFLLECAEVALYDEIQKELELLQRQEIKCLGIVVAEV